MPSKADKQLESAMRQARSTTRPELDEQVLSAAFAVIEERDAKSKVSSHGRDAASMTAIAAGGRSRIIFRRRMLTSLATIVLVAGGISLWFVQPRDSWAQVVAAVQSNPWVLMTSTGPGGERDEVWVSTSRDVSAVRRGNEISFDDYRRGIRYVYRVEEKQLFEIQNPGGPGRERLDFFRGMFRQLVRGDKNLKLPRTVSKIAIVEQSRRTVREDDHTWIEYELAFRLQHSKSSTEKGRLRFLVDPKTRLPRSMAPLSDGQPVTAAEVVFSYPEEGPADIYDLGVPRDAELLAGVSADDVPRDREPRKDVRELLDKIRNSGRQFDDYSLRHVFVQGDTPWHAGLAARCYRKGGKWRSEYGFLDPNDRVLPDPAADANQDEWWKARFAKLWYSPLEVDDGRTLYKNVAVPSDWADKREQRPLTYDRDSWPKPKWQPIERRPDPSLPPPLRQVYKTIHLGTPESKVEITPESKQAPAGCLLLSIENQPTEGRPLSVDRYWIDPNHSFIITRHTSIVHRVDRNGKLDVSERNEVVEEIGISPKGLAYPKRITETLRNTKDGKTTTTISKQRCYFDFEAEIPDGLFEVDGTEITR